MEKSISIKAYALDSLRRYLIVNDIEIGSKDEFTAVYFDMYKAGYFYKADVSNKLEEVKATFDEFSRAYTKDKDILEKDLIFFGSRRVIEKMEAIKINKKISVK